MSEFKRAYPLDWPAGWKRTSLRKEGRFYTNNKAPTVAQAVERVMLELQRLGIRRYDLIISTNVPTRMDGLPRSDQGNPLDPGVAVYWRKGQNGAMKCMAIDRYRAVADNLCAIAATLEAMRAIERHGGAEILERTFSGFAALPANASQPWRTVLEFPDDGLTTPADVESRYRTLVLKYHPDGQAPDRERFEAIVQARKDALAELGR